MLLCTIYQSQAMQRKAGDRSQSFLQKFQGKKTAVGKEGLIHLLQQKLESIAPNPKVIISNRYPIPQKTQSQSTPVRKKQLAPLNEQNSPTIDRETPKIHQSQRYSQRKQQNSSAKLPSRKNQPQNIKQLNNQQLINNKLKLPSINKIQSQSLHNRIPPIPSFNTQGRNPRMKSLPRKAGQSQSMVLNNFDKLLELDSYALKHLQSLDKFEQHLIKQKVDNATRSALSEPK